MAGAMVNITQCDGDGVILLDLDQKAGDFQNLVGSWELPGPKIYLW